MQYFDALKTGNSAQASQLWLQMTPDQRAKFERGEGIRPSVTHNDVQQAIDDATPSRRTTAPRPIGRAGAVRWAGLGEIFKPCLPIPKQAAPPSAVIPRRPAITR